MKRISLFTLSMATVLAVTPISGMTAASATAAGTLNKSNSSGYELYQEPKILGEASQELTEISTELNTFISQRPEVFAGGYLTADQKSVVLTVALAEDPAVKELDDLIEKLDPGLKMVEKLPVKYSWDDLERAKNEISQNIISKSAGPINGVSIDIMNNKIVVDTIEPLNSRSLEIDPSFNTLATKFSGMISVRESEADLRGQSSDDDVAPHYGGAKYVWHNATDYDQSANCSLAFPLVVNSVTYGLTAGHCRPASSHNFVRAWSPAGYWPGHFFGSYHTTTWVGTQNTYGDFALIKGSTYGSFVYNGPRGSSSALPVVDAHFYTPLANSQLCVSGAVSGQKCRLFITNTSACSSISNVYTCSLILCKSDQNLDGTYDCSTTSDGDSGGAVYAAAPGGVRAFGVHSAAGACGSNGATMAATSLVGIRKWSPNAYIPVY